MFQSFCSLKLNTNASTISVECYVKLETSALRRIVYRVFLLIVGRFEFARVPNLCLRKMPYLVFC